jgi:hypothetical protein
MFVARAENSSAFCAAEVEALCSTAMAVGYSSS